MTPNQDQMTESGYERMKRIRQQDFDASIRELELLTERNKDRIHFLSQESYKLGIKFSIREIEGTEMLMEKAHKELPYSNPKEAEREHRNLMNILRTMKSRLAARYEGKP